MNQDLTYALRLIAPRMHHHASHSGYDRLVHSLPGEVIYKSESLTLPERFLGRLLRGWVERSGLRWYRRRDLLNEIACGCQWLGGGRLFHFLYGENSYRYLGQLRRRSERNRIVATYHTPERRFREVVRQASHLAHLDAVIVVSTIQREFLQTWLPSDKIFYVPHGIDTDFYCPGSKTRTKSDVLTCISVGSHLRDYRTLGEVARLSAARKLDVRFVVVAPESCRRELGETPNVEWRSDLSDVELLTAYRRADLLLLPLDDCTANNALLEGMATGLPVLATDLPGVHDYVTPNCALLVMPDDPEAMIEALTSLLDSPERLSSMAAASRERALELDWSRTAEQMLNVYRQVTR